MLQIKKLYNIMALALKKAEECMNEHDFERMRDLDDAYETALTEELKRRSPDMFDKNTRNISEASEWHLGKSSVVEDRTAYTSYNIDFYLRNFYYIHERDVEAYSVQHILMPREVFKEAVCRGELRIMVSPVSGDEIVNVTEPYIRNNTRFVSVNPIRYDKEEHLEKNIIKVLEGAALKEADILLFPEMLGTESTELI